MKVERKALIQRKSFFQAPSQALQKYLQKGRYLPARTSKFLQILLQFVYNADNLFGYCC